MYSEKREARKSLVDQKMKESLDELSSLRAELQSLLVKFGLRALKTYQAARNFPLRSNEIASLVKYEIENAIHDAMEQESKDAIIKKAKIEWEKQHSTKQQ